MDVHRDLLPWCHIFNFILNINIHGSHSEVERPPAEVENKEQQIWHESSLMATCMEK